VTLLLCTVVFTKAAFCHQFFFRCMSMILFADDIVLFSSSCHGLQKMLDVCEQNGSLWDIKFNPSKSYAWAFGGSHPSNINVTLADRPVQWVTRVKYLGCTMIYRSSEIDVSPLVDKFYGSFNNILRVVGACITLKWYRCSWINRTFFLILCIVVKHGKFVQASYVLPVLLEQFVSQNF